MVSADEVLRRTGARVREVREERALTQAQVASEAQISRSSLANIEAGRQNVTLRQLAAVAATLHVTVSELVSQGVS